MSPQFFVFRLAGRIACGVLAMQVAKLSTSGWRMLSRAISLLIFSCLFKLLADFCIISTCFIEQNQQNVCLYGI